MVGESGVVALRELLERLQSHCAFRRVLSKELCDKRTDQPLYLSSRTWYGHLYICVSRPDLFVESQSLYFDSMHNSTLLQTRKITSNPFAAEDDDRAHSDHPFMTVRIDHLIPTSRLKK